MMYSIAAAAVAFIMYLITRYVFKPKTPMVTFDDKIKMYGRKSCGYTVKMLNEIQKANVMDKFEYIDVETPAGEKEFKKTDADGVPHFESSDRSKSVTGAMPLNDLLQQLQ